MKVLVCGGRDWSDQAMVDAVLNGLYEREHWITVIHGGARGADRYAREWATRRLSKHPFPGLLNIYVKEFRLTGRRTPRPPARSATGGCSKKASLNSSSRSRTASITR